jgi:hypothetical protein
VQRVRATLEGNAPEVVHRVLGGEHDPDTRPESEAKAEPERECASVQRTAAELRPDHRELAERGIDDPPLQVGMPLKDEPEHGRENEQQRKDREEAVIGDRRRQVAALVVDVLLQHRKREAQPPMPLLEAIEGAIPLPEPAHSTFRGRWLAEANPAAAKTTAPRRAAVGADSPRWPGNTADLTSESLPRPRVADQRRARRRPLSVAGAV